MKFFAPALALALLAAPRPAQEGQPVLLQPRYLKEDKISTHLQTKVVMSVSLKLDLGGEAQTVRSETEMDTETAYLSEILGADDPKLVRRERREYLKARMTTKIKQAFGDQEADLPPNKQTLPLEGRTFEILREEDGSKVSPKGDAKDVPKALYANLQVHDGVDRLLPATPVRPGDTWTVEGKRLMEWISGQMEGLKPKSVTGSVECRLKEITGEGKARLARVEFTYDMETTVEMSAAAEDGEDDGKPAPKVKTEMTLRVKKGKGHFLFDIDQGQSTAAELEAPMEIEMSQQIAGQEITGKGKGTVEMKSRWKLEERKSP